MRQKTEVSLGYGYLDPYVTNAAITAVKATDPTTLTVTTSRKNDRILQMYLPILPEHVWKGVTIDKVGDFVNKPPVVGTGPYQVVDWKNGQSARLVRNKNYWGPQGAADEIVFQFFPDATNAMVDAFKNGELDYIRNPTGLQFDQLKTLPGVVAINAAGNGFTQINFNCYDKDIPDGGASTKAFRDPAFRAALGYAIDREALITRVLNSYGVAGTTQVPAWQRAWHAEPNDVRPFDLTMAAQKLEEAGYPLKDGVRYDKEGKALNLQPDVPGQRRLVSQGRPVHHRLVRPDRDQGHLAVDGFGQSRDGRVPRHDDPAQGPAQVRHGHLGLGRRPGPELPAPDPDHRRDQRFERQPVVERRTTTRCTRSRTRRPRATSARVSWTRCSSSSTTRRRTRSCTTTTSCTSTGRTSSRTGRHSRRTAARRSSSTARSTTRPSNWRRRHRRRRRPPRVRRPVPARSPGASAAATPAPSGDGSSTGSSGNSTLLILGILLVVIGIGAAVVLSRRRRTAVEDE